MSDSDNSAENDKPNVFNRAVAKLLRWLIGHKAVSLAAAVVLLILSVAGMSRVRNVFSRISTTGSLSSSAISRHRAIRMW